MPHPGRLTLGKETGYPFDRRLGGPQVRSGRLDTGIGQSSSVSEAYQFALADNCEASLKHMYVCVYKYVCMHMCVCIYIYIYIYMYECIKYVLCMCVQDPCWRATGSVLHRNKNGRQKRMGFPTAALPCGSARTFGVGCAPAEPRVYTSGMASDHVSTSTAAGL
jgi:hypothetical protein